MTSDKGHDTEADEIEFLPQEAETETGMDTSGAASGELEVKQREYDALYDRYVRLLAEFDNYKKLAAKERDQYLQYGNEERLKEWLPILDNIERALRHAEEHHVSDAVVKGWALILKQCQDILDRAGVTAIESLGSPFNPEWHQAIAQTAGHGQEGVVVEEAQRGYLLKGKLLRPALVTVSKGPAE
jgi:molecular chaperone GrpE